MTSFYGRGGGNSGGSGTSNYNELSNKPITNLTGLTAINLSTLTIGLYSIRGNYILNSEDAETKTFPSPTFVKVLLDTKSGDKIVTYDIYENGKHLTYSIDFYPDGTYKVDKYTYEIISTESGSTEDLPEEGDVTKLYATDNGLYVWNESAQDYVQLGTGEVKANTDAIAALDVRVTAIDKANDGKLAVIESNISDIDARVTALDKEGGRVALIEGRVSTVESDVSTLKGQITGLTGAMHWRGEVESLEGLTGYVSGDVVSVKGSAQEYIFDGENWKLFGDEGSYALKDNVYTKSEVYTKTETDGLLTALTTAHEGLISAAEGRAAEDATSKANTAEANAKAYVDAAMSWIDME